MPKPSVAITIDGVPMQGQAIQRLISLTITDREGIQSDTIELQFNDDKPRIASPRRGAEIAVALNSGRGEAAFTGRYIVDRVDFRCLPYTMSVSGHSADLRRDMKVAKVRHWDEISVGDIVRQIATENGLEARIAEGVADYVYPTINQQDESDLAFLDRLAARSGALFSIKGGRLLWLDKGSGLTAAGNEVATVEITREDIVPGSCSVTESDVERFATVKAYYQDYDAAERKEIIVDADPEASGEKVLREPFGSVEEATRAAKACAIEMTRGVIRTSCSLVGRTNISAGGPFAYCGVRQDIDGRVFILEDVIHAYSKAGLTTDIAGRLRRAD